VKFSVGFSSQKDFLYLGKDETCAFGFLLALICLLDYLPRIFTSEENLD
jgi:hypothetical protein